MIAEDWGPWCRAIDLCERIGRLRFLGATVQCGYGIDHPLIPALWWAESGEPADLEEARLELERMPTRDRRKIISVYGAATKRRTEETARRKINVRTV